MTKLLAIVILYMLAVLHSIHISYGQATISRTEINGKLTFYKDDFLKALGNYHGRQMQKLTNAEYDSIKASYLAEHFTIKNGKSEKIKIMITGNQENESTIWFSFRALIPSNFTSLILKCTILTDEFSDQLNLLNIKSPDGELSLIFSKSNNEKQIVL